MQSKNEIWCRAGQVPQDYQFMGQVAKVFSNIWFKQALTDRISKFFINFQDGICSIYFLKSELQENSKMITVRAIKHPGWGIKLLEKTEKAHQEYFKYTETLRNIDYPKKSGKELIKLLKGTHILNIIGHEVTRSFSWQLDKDNRRLNQYVIKMVDDQIKARNKNFKARVIIPQLTTPLKDTFIFTEQLELLNIAVRIVKSESIKEQFAKYSDGKRISEEIMQRDEKLYKIIYEHYKNYRWLSYIYQEPAYELSYYINRLRDLVLDESSISRLISRYKNGKKKTQDVRKILLDELKFNKNQLKILEFARGLTFIKEYRRAVTAHGTFCIEKIYQELCKKYDITMDQLRMLDYFELKKAIEKNYFDKGDLKKRVQAVTFYFERNTKRKVLLGSDSIEFLKGIKFEERKELKEKIVEGVIASSGKITAQAKIVNKPEDIEKMNDGDIIVTRITATNLGTAVSKAAGIISECGGLTCHAAILSRELGVPCLVGVEDATRIIKDGDEVELDAENGIVKIL